MTGSDYPAITPHLLTSSSELTVGAANYYYITICLILFQAKAFYKNLRLEFFDTFMEPR
jgi:hypothetical protein